MQHPPGGSNTDNLTDWVNCWMKSAGNHCFYAGRLLWLLLAFISFNVFNAAGQNFSAPSEPTFAVLKTRTGVYTNVTVTKMTKSWIFVLHANGVCNIKIEDLTPETRVALGYDKLVAAENAKSSRASTHPFAPFANFKLTQVKKFAADLQQNAPKQLKAKLDQMTGGNPVAMYLILGIVAAVHIFVSTCFWLICRKTHSAPGPLVWVPVFQLIPLLRAANMPRLWFFVYLIPVLNVLAQIVWSVKICKTRGKSPFVAFLLILPPTTVFAFLYLAFSRSAPVSFKTTEILSLEVA